MITDWCINAFTALIPSMTERENHMMAIGTFVYSSLPFERVAKLFDEYEVAYSKKVKHDTNISDRRSKQCTLDYLNTSRLSQYATLEERGLRFQMFKDGLKRIDELNADEKATYGTTSSIMSEYTDYTPQDTVSQLSSFQLPRTLRSAVPPLVRLQVLWTTRGNKINAGGWLSVIWCQAYRSNKRISPGRSFQSWISIESLSPVHCSCTE